MDAHLSIWAEQVVIEALEDKRRTRVLFDQELSTSTSIGANGFAPALTSP
jgi:hypothetical protein